MKSFFSFPIIALFLLPTSVASASAPKVEVRRGVPYVEGGSGRQKLDVYFSEMQGPRPVLVFLHGGGWVAGDRFWYRFVGKRFAQAGFVAVLPSYRLAPKNRHPAQIDDAAAAVAWTFRHASEFGGDARRLFVAGHSAGGHLASLLATRPEHLARFGLGTQDLRGVISMSGVYDVSIAAALFGISPASILTASPLYQVNGSPLPPFLISYCQHDWPSLPRQARDFHLALLNTGHDSQLAYIPGKNHVTQVLGLRKDTDPTWQAISAFLHTYGAPSRGATSPAAAPGAGSGHPE